MPVFASASLAAARQDVDWWFTHACAWNGIHIISPGLRITHTIFTDASGTKGADGVFGCQWYSIKLPLRFRHRDIQVKEFYALVHAILCWGPAFAHSHVVFMTDNTDVFHALCNLSTRSCPSMDLLRRFLGLASQLDFTFEVSWIPSASNSQADAASRFEFKRLFSLAPYLLKKSSTKVFLLGHRLPSLSRDPLHILLSSFLLEVWIIRGAFRVRLSQPSGLSRRFSVGPCQSPSRVSWLPWGLRHMTA